MSAPMPSPSINGIIGWLGTLIELSALTVIFSPVFGVTIFPVILSFVVIFCPKVFTNVTFLILSNLLFLLLFNSSINDHFIQ